MDSSKALTDCDASVGAIAPIRFIGSKERLLPFIINIIRTNSVDRTRTVADVFCGTAVVSRALKSMGYNVIANDNLQFCTMLAKAALHVSTEPEFKALVESGTVSERLGLFTSPYDAVVHHLNSLEGVEGFIYREYSPGGSSSGPFVRSYFTDSNAQRIDAIRLTLSTWYSQGLISNEELALLVSDLIRAANKVANIAGTYGCFLKQWEPRAAKQLVLRRSEIIPGTGSYTVFCSDANALVKHIRVDSLYLDPPYTWRHYGAYYHLLETIAIGDEPVVSGKTGLRPWEHTRSPYCDRTKASTALLDLVASAQCKDIFLSYSSEGLISREEILDILSRRGSPVVYEMAFPRYRSNGGGSKRNLVKERLYHVRVVR